ncbi:MAG: class I SAM-dependent methyltransferase [Caldilineaceae bacterium]
MEPHEIATRYDQIAQRWQHDLQASAYGLAQLARAIQFTTLRGCALDVGCGSSGRFINAFVEHGFQAEGLDVAGEMVQLARALHPTATFYTADICHWQPPKHYSLITAWDSTFHLPLASQAPVLRKLCNALESNGVLLFTCGGGHTSGEIMGSFHGLDFGYSTLGVDAFLQILAEQQCTCRHLEYDQYPEKHVYIIAQKI